MRLNQKRRFSEPKRSHHQQQQPEMLFHQELIEFCMPPYLHSHRCRAIKASHSEGEEKWSDSWSARVSQNLEGFFLWEKRLAREEFQGCSSGHKKYHWAKSNSCYPLSLPLCTQPLQAVLEPLEKYRSSDASAGTHPSRPETLLHRHIPTPILRCIVLPLLFSAEELIYKLISKKLYKVCCKMINMSSNKKTYSHVDSFTYRFSLRKLSRSGIPTLKSSCEDSNANLRTTLIFRKNCWLLRCSTSWRKEDGIIAKRSLPSTLQSWQFW